MKRKLFGMSCMTLVLACVVGGFIAMFVATIVFNQAQASSQNASATTRAAFTRTPLPTATRSQAEPLPGSTDSSSVEVTVETPNQVATPTPSPIPWITNTPGLPPMGTMSYPMTVTAQYVLDQTRVALYLGGVGATETEIAQENVSIFALLTAAAPTPRARDRKSVV